MQDFWNTVTNWLVNFVQTEWFAAYVALGVTVLISAIAQAASNRISRSDFTYRINQDFSGSEDIKNVYAWLEKCRNDNKRTENYRSLAEVFPKKMSPGSSLPSFTDIDTYINHFEAVYVISKGVIFKGIKLKNIDRLFQQRFLTFMHNPYVQSQVLCPNFTSNDNLFELYRNWIKLRFRRTHFNSKKLAEYLNEYTCGAFEYSVDDNACTKLSCRKRLAQRWRRSREIRNYVPNLCNPKYMMGYCSVENSRTSSLLTVRIIPSRSSDLNDLVDLETKVVTDLHAEKHGDYYFPAGKKDIADAISNPDCICLQIDDEDRVAAFAFVRLYPNDEEKFEEQMNSNSLLKSYKPVPGRVAVFETVFVAKEYRGYGLQLLLTDILCHLARSRGANSIRAVVHPDNENSLKNLIGEDKGCFIKATKNIVVKRGGKRYTRVVLCRDLRNLHKRLGIKDRKTGKYYINP